MIKYDKLWETMKKKGITQYKLIKKYDVNEAILYRLRHNMIVKTTTIDMLCRILECSVDEIMEYEKDK